MEQREKLIELLKQDPELFFDRMGGDDYENLADHLLANGVVVLPCRCCECEYQQECKNAQYFGLDGYCSRGERKGGDE